MSNQSTPSTVVTPVFTDTNNLEIYFEFKKENFSYKDEPELITNVKQEILDDECCQSTEVENMETDFNLRYPNIFTVEKEPSYKIENMESLNENKWKSTHEGVINIKDEDLEQSERRSSSWVEKEKQESYLIDQCDERIRKENIKNTFTSYTESFNDGLLNSVPKKTNKFHCNQCSYQTRRRFDLKKHSVIHKKSDEVDIFKCSDCDFETKHKKSMNTHLLKHKNPDEVNTFKCNQCSYRTIRRDALKQHSVVHKKPDEVDMFKCNQCGFQTVYKSSLKEHLLVQHRNPSDVNQSGNLGNHMVLQKKLMRTNEFKCDQCNYETHRKDYLKLHYIRHKNPDELDMFKCDQCNYQTLRKDRMNTHLRRHDEFKNMNKLKCDLCSYETIFKDLFRRHVRRHEKFTQIAAEFALIN